MNGPTMLASFILFVLTVAAYFVIKSFTDAARRDREARRAEAAAKLRDERALGLY